MQITLTRILIQSSTTEHVLGMEAFISRLLSFRSCYPSNPSFKRKLVCGKYLKDKTNNNDANANSLQ